MGLLDDAIREHLELKRRRGADPGEIAHQERSALEPVFAAEQPTDAHSQADPLAGDHSAEADPGAVADPTPPVTPISEIAEGGERRLADFSSAGQETAELDMQAVLEGDEHTPAPNAGPAAEEDPLEWEMPGHSERRHAAEEVPGQERLSFE
jgi:hypothetical protein